MKSDLASSVEHRRGRITGIALAWLACATTGLLYAQSSAGGSASEKIDAIFADLDTTTGPGCSVAAARNGKTLYSRGYGMADLEHRVPIGADTVFHVASVSKQFTAAAIVLLAQQQALSLDDQVGKYLPQFPDFGAPITIRQLVHHTSGIRDQWISLDVAGWRYSRDLISDADVMRVFARQNRLNFEPGSQFSYSNTGYTLMAQIVKRVSGQSLRAFTKERIFVPLGMDRTHFRDDFREIVPDIAYGYTRENGVLKTSVTNFDTVGATGLLTTAEDLMRWQENFHAAKVGGPAFVAQMLEKGRLQNDQEIPYAFAVEHDTYRGLPTVSHSGSDAGYVAQLLGFPQQHFSVAALCNADYAYPSVRALQVADVFLAAEFPEQRKSTVQPRPVRASVSPAQLQAKVGTYLYRKGGFHVYRIIMKDNALYAQRRDQLRELVPLNANVFTVRGMDVDLEFTGSKDGARELIYRKHDGSLVQAFEQVTQYDPSVSTLSQYVGDYASDEFELTYRIMLDQGRLTLGSLKLEPTDMKAVTPDMFESEWANLKFDRDSQGRISAFTLNWWYGPETYRFERTRQE